VVDRFANGESSNDLNLEPNSPFGYHGGDWQGIIDKLDYFESLGVTVIWISPVYKNVEKFGKMTGYHGYWIQDFKKTNPHFGDLEKLREMIKECHRRNIKVILDVVVNHIGMLFYYDLNGNGHPDEPTAGCETSCICENEPPFDSNGVMLPNTRIPAPILWYHDNLTNRIPIQPPDFQNLDWYHRKGVTFNWTDPVQVVQGDFPTGLKDLDTSNPKVRKALTDVCNFWIDQTDADGFRIDTFRHVEHGFWQEFSPAIRNHCFSQGKRNFFLFGEVFIEDNDRALGSQRGI